METWLTGRRGKISAYQRNIMACRHALAYGGVDQADDDLASADCVWLRWQLYCWPVGLRRQLNRWPST
jgi:hypothetical protein